MYTLIMLNSQGASETTSHDTIDAVREKIRTWHAETMTARVIDSNGHELYDGPALEFNPR